MILQNTYIVGTLVQFYEIEMVSEHIDSCIQMLTGVDNPENVTFLFTWCQQEYLEKIDTAYHGENCVKSYDRFADLVCGKLSGYGCKVNIIKKTNDDSFYNIARFRRDFIYNWCEHYDFLLFGETDSLWPSRTLSIIGGLWEQANSDTPKFLCTFAYRLNWDSSWKKLVHPMFQSVLYDDRDSFVLHHEASEKSYMTLVRMNEINDGVPMNEIEIWSFEEPKADGSCLIMSADLAMSIGGMPHCLIHSGEDEAIVRQCKLVMGNNMVQYHVHNQLRVHNRRHPQKRVGILNENNPAGFCDNRKGEWWTKLENASKFNLEYTRHQKRMNRLETVLNELKGQ